VIIDELETSHLYGETFALYDDKSFDEFIEPLRARLSRNQIDKSLFRGKKCLDAGCGGGRGTVLLAEMGASEVTALDLSERNLFTTAERSRQKRCADVIKPVLASVLKLPFPDETFDIVWCNGVLHHTRDPGQGLREITRVLKTGGFLWLYLYGGGGVYNYAMDTIRQWVKPVGVERTLKTLQEMGLSVRRIAEYMDDWFVPYFFRYHNLDIEKILGEAGYTNTQRLSAGLNYDTSERLSFSGEEPVWMGEGDLRYFCRKNEKNIHCLEIFKDLLSDKCEYHPKLISSVEPRFAKLSAWLDSLHDSRDQRILSAQMVHQALNDLHERESQFDVNEFLLRLSSIESSIESVKRLAAERLNEVF
jgi:ubiquinone/menaquinone biosynthesis C-methylase UbiE